MNLYSIDATREEVIALIDFYDFLVGSVGIEHLPNDWAETYSAADKAINALEKAL